jgi:ATP-dependent exoDNAse (exonuclease V) beta subunit
MFNYDLLPKISLERNTRNGVRYYHTPTGNYPSVTTLLKTFYDKKEVLDNWKARVGEAEANKISHQARTRGTNLHDICERFLLNDPEYSKGHMPYTVEDFTFVRNLLSESIDEIYGIELPLYSRTLKTAGTTDLVCSWNGVRSIVDYKTSRKQKKEEWIEDYLVQSTIYGLMANEMFDLGIEQVVVILMVEGEPPQVFTKPLSTFKEKAYEVCVSNRPDTF